jgi:hypothetical protein
LQTWSHVAKIAGVEAESVAHATEGLIRRLPQLEAENGKATEGLEKLGLSFKDLKTLTPDEMIDTLMYSLASLDEPLERNAIGSQLFGGEWKNLAPILGMGEDAIKATRDEAYALGAVMDGDALNGANEFRKTMVRLQTQAMAFANDVGSKLAPILTDVLVPAFQEHVAPALAKVGDLVLSLINWFGNLSPTAQKVVLAIVGITAALGPVILFIGKLITIVKTAIVVGKAMGVVFAGLTWPIGLTIAAVVALIAIGVLLWKNWDTVKEKASQLWSKLTEIFNRIKTVIGEKITEAKTKITETFNSILSFVTGLDSSFYNAGKGLIDQMINGIKNMATKAINAVKDIAGKIRNLLPFSPAKSGPLSDLDKLDFGGPITDSIGKGLPKVQASMSHMLEVPSMNVKPMSTARTSVNNQATGQSQTIHRELVSLEIPLTVDGKEIARASIGDINALLARAGATTMRMAGVRR